MYKNILLPLDGSELAEEAIPTAIDLATIFGGRITLIQIKDEVLPVFKEDQEAESKVLRERGEEYLNQIKGRVEENGVHADIVVKIKAGKAALGICEYAESGEVDLIILSTHGFGAIKDWSLGSVSDKVMRHSPKPVLLLRVPRTSPLKGKTVLVVDDEEDILETVEDALDICRIYKASDYNTALQYLQNRTFDLVILDIMGVNGFELLNESVSRGFPAVMLTAHALTPEALERAVKLGAVSFLPKEKISELKDFLEDVIQAGGKSVWKKLFNRLGSYFRKSFGSEWEDKEDLLKEFEKAVKEREK